MYQVLIAEDEKRIRMGLKKHIPWSNMGYEVVADVDNGEVALEQFERLRPHVVLTDIRMQNMDGLDLMKAIRERCDRTRIVVISGYNDFEYAQRSIQYNVSAYLLKPTKSYEFQQAFQKVKQELFTMKEEGNGTMWSGRVWKLPHDQPDPHLNLKKALNYIEQHYSNKITLKEAADKAFMSPSYFSKHFKQSIGQTFIEYLTALRLDQAKRLLLTTNYKIIEIAVMVGYDDFRHFCKLFKAKEGIAPSMFREAQHHK